MQVTNKIYLYFFWGVAFVHFEDMVFICLGKVFYFCELGKA